MIAVTIHPIADKAAQSHIAGVVDLVFQQAGYRTDALDARHPERITVKYQRKGDRR